MKYEHLLTIVSRRKMKRLVHKYDQEIIAGFFLGIMLGIAINH